MSTGVVIIGRNEGERLERCLASARSAAQRVVYVDSGSSDGSAAEARATGAEVVELDLSRPFSAARARNEGFARLRLTQPDVEFVQFVDGDCELAPGWLERGAAELARWPELAAVCGRLRERFPEASIYNRLCDREWDGPAGEVAECGGIAMYRVSSFLAVGGFDGSVPAGEEPELCHRLRQEGWKIVRLPDDMGWHDAAMHRFLQWWKRQVRAGYGALDIARRFGLPQYARQVVRARRWVVGWGLAVAGGAAAALLTRDAVLGLVIAALATCGVLLQAARLATREFREHGQWRIALAYGCLTALGKWPQVLGQCWYYLDRARGRHPRLIEHKTTTPSAHTTG
jgi:glycosyltransferase involved in cell wall biosynthesis